MKTSPAGVLFISTFEGWRDTTYLDTSKLWTIGYGHLIRPDEQYLLTTRITKELGLKLLERDIRLAEDCVASNTLSFGLEQHQFNALVSFTFNLGCRTLRNSTLLSRIRKGDKHAIDDILIWNRDKLGVRQGLIRRRACEWLMYEGREVDLA